MTKAFKKVSKKDMKKSEISTFIWLAIIGASALLISLGFILATSNNTAIEPQNQTPEKTTTVQMETSKGIITMVIEDSKMPKTVQNFKNLINRSFYNNLIFHRVEDWVIQGGDPTGTGNGGSEQTIPLETHPDLTHKRGAIGMARTTDPNSATSQFYIVKKDAHQIDGQYAIFGNVTSGMDVVDKINTKDNDKIISVKIIQ